MVSASEYAVLASAAYARDDNALALRKIQEDSNGRFKSNDYEVLEGDKDYKVFKKVSTGEIIIACRGTATKEDANPDLYIAGGVLPLHERSKKVTEVVRKYRKSYDDVTITGHSLGGALAAAAAVRTDTMAVTFNQGSSPIDGVVQGIGKLLGYRYKNVIHFAVCNDVVSSAACLVDNVTNIRVPTVKSSIMSALKNHKLGQFLLLNDQKYNNVLTSTRTRVHEHQQSNPDEVDGPNNPVNNTVKGTGAAYASYKAFLASIDKALSHLRTINDPTLNTYIDRVQNAVDTLRDVEERILDTRRAVVEGARRTALDMLQSRLRAVGGRLLSIFERVPREEVENIQIELDGIFDATYDQHANEFFDHMTDQEIEDELTAIEEQELNEFIAAADDVPLTAEEEKELDEFLDINPVDEDMELDDFIDNIDVDAIPDDPEVDQELEDLLRGDDIAAVDDIGLDMEEVEAVDGLEIAEVGEFIAGVEGVSSVLASAGPIFAVLGVVVGVAVGMYTSSKLAEARETVRNRIQDIRKKYSQEFHSLTNKMSTYVTQPRASVPGPTSTQKMIIQGVEHRVEVPTIQMPGDIGRWKDSAFDYYGPDVLRYLQWRAAHPNIVGPTSQVVNGIGAAYRSLISPGVLWPARGDGSYVESVLISEEQRRKSAAGQSLSASRPGVAGYIDAYEWLLRDNIRVNGGKYKQRVEELMANHTVHRFDELSDNAQKDWLLLGESQLYINLDSRPQLEIARLSKLVRDITRTITMATRWSENASSFVEAAGRLYNDYARMITTDLSIEEDREHARGFLERNVDAFVEGVLAMSDDNIMYDSFFLNGADMSSYQVYVSAGTMHQRRQWHRTIKGNNEKNKKLQEWLKDDSYSMDSYIQTGHPFMGDNETESEFADRYIRWVQETATAWEWKTHRAVVLPHIPPHHAKRISEYGAVVQLPDAFQPPLDPNLWPEGPDPTVVPDDDTPVTCIRRPRKRTRRL